MNCHAVNGADGQPVGYADPKHFCRSCHDYESVSIDCFECHDSKPGRPRRPPRSGSPADDRDLARSTTICARCGHDPPDLARGRDRSRAGGRSCAARARSPPQRSRPASLSTHSAPAPPGAAPGEAVSSKVRWGMLIDINKCGDGCDHCVTACREENGWGGSGNRETDAQWIRKVSLQRSQDRLERRSAGDVPALRRPALRRSLPDRRLVQARRRHRAGRQAHLHRLPLLHDGLPLQGALVRARADRRPEAERAARQGHGRKLHNVRRPHRCGPSAGLRRRLLGQRRRRDDLRRPQRSRERHRQGGRKRAPASRSGPTSV